MAPFTHMLPCEKQAIQPLIFHTTKNNLRTTKITEWRHSGHSGHSLKVALLQRASRMVHRTLANLGFSVIWDYRGENWGFSIKPYLNVGLQKRQF